MRAQTPEPDVTSRGDPPALQTELLLLPDGRILVHNLTPAFARLLLELNPNATQIEPRAFTSQPTESVTHNSTCAPGAPVPKP